MKISGNYITGGSLVSNSNGGVSWHKPPYETTLDFKLDVVHARIDNPGLSRKEAEDYCMMLHKMEIKDETDC